MMMSVNVFSKIITVMKMSKPYLSDRQSSLLFVQTNQIRPKYSPGKIVHHTVSCSFLSSKTGGTRGATI